MSTRHYLFGFSGRISRAKIWLWVLFAFAAALVMCAVSQLGFDWTATKAALHATPPVDMAHAPKPGSKGIISLVALIALALIAIALLWSKLAVYTKRLHDRGKSAWWLLVYVALPVVLHGYACHAAGPHMPCRPMTMFHAMPVAGKAACAVALLIALWAFIDLFCRKGVKGANKYGADPLEPNWCDPEKPVKGCVPKPEEPKAE